MPQSSDLIVAVLAAGASRRLGRAKQLVSIGGEPLLRRQCRCALGANVGNVLVVLGFNADEHRSLIQDLPVDVRVNHSWEEGLAATLRCAVRAAQMQGVALLVLPCDQYRIVPEDLGALYHRWRLAPTKACVSRAGEYAGPPVILPVEYHDRVRRLRGDMGARSLIYGSLWSGPEEVVNPRASFDLDSPTDLRIAQAWDRRRSP
jgi:molybdenum cofactor cytidylyltransferase